jgi:hypothetical protein
MSPAVWNKLGFGDPTPVLPVPEKPLVAKQCPVRALPAPWYTSQQMYELERRAIFSRRWLFMTHQNRLKEPGDYLTYNFAGFGVIIIKVSLNNIQSRHQRR